MNKLRPNQRVIILWATAAVLLAGCGTPAPATVSPTGTIVSLTFDDGDADNLDSAAMLSQHNLRATWYVPSGLAGKPGYLTWEQLRAMHAAGHEIGGHSLDHLRLDGLPQEALRRQICQDRDVLRQQGLEPVSFAYPFGGYDDAAKQMVRECGYSNARSIGAGPDSVPPRDAFALRAYPYIVSDTSFSKLRRYVTGTVKEGGGWLILIFHHVCDDCDYFAVRPEVLQRFIPWLAEQQAQGLLQVRTVGDVVQGGSP
ncbi:MAG TPA: polysaccharide deacetylase family protein [Anaerolineales bacterium]|nr:polysaccharide deacetylase family protein [Anaerolineales bacterium]